MLYLFLIAALFVGNLSHCSIKDKTTDHSHRTVEDYKREIEKLKLENESLENAYRYTLLVHGATCNCPDSSCAYTNKSSCCGFPVVHVEGSVAGQKNCLCFLGKPFFSQENQNAQVCPNYRESMR